MWYEHLIKKLMSSKILKEEQFKAEVFWQQLFIKLHCHNVWSVEMWLGVILGLYTCFKEKKQVSPVSFTQHLFALMFIHYKACCEGSMGNAEAFFLLFQNLKDFLGLKKKF